MKMKNKGFTLIELLVVIAIIGALFAFLMPALMSSKEKARQAKCMNHLRQFGIAIDLYRSTHNDDFPNFLSNLYPTYIDTKEMYICPSDRSNPKGSEGGKPPHEPDKRQFSETDDVGEGPNENTQYAHLRNLDIDYCSYLYEFCGADCSWAPGYTWKEKKLEEMMEGSELQSGETAHPMGQVPIVRCFWHAIPKGSGYAEGSIVLNLAVEDRRIFKSGPEVDDWKLKH